MKKPLFLTLILLVLLPASMLQAQHYYYENMRIELELDKSKMMVGFVPGTSMEQLSTLLALEETIAPLSADKFVGEPYNMAICEFNRTQTDSEVEALLARLTSSSEITTANLYLRDPQMPSLEIGFTDELIVKLLPSTSRFWQI